MRFDFEQYFRDYGAAFAQPEVLASFYGDCALSSASSFVGCLKGKNEVIQALRTVAAHQEKMGLVSMTPLLVETSELDPIHRLARVRWKMKFLEAGEISFAASYLLREEPHKVIILLYLAHEDGEKMRKGPGLTEI
jgi:hypothetical protein